MATQYVCDRCGDTSESPYDVRPLQVQTLPSQHAPTTTATNHYRADLCLTCRETVINQIGILLAHR